MAALGITLRCLRSRCSGSFPSTCPFSSRNALLPKHHARTDNTKNNDQSITRLVFGSCADYVHDGSNDGLQHWDTIRKINPDLIVLMGDNVYGASSSLKEEYGKLTSHPVFQELRHKVVAVVDDNDLVGAESLDEAVRLFVETFQPQLSTTEGRKGLYQSYSYNDDELQLILLDLRVAQPTRMSAATATNTATTTVEEDDHSQHPHDYQQHPSGSLSLGKTQWTWLEEQLSKPFRRRIVVSSLQILASSHEWDCWQTCMPHERQRLLDLLQTTSGNTLLLSGDRHASALYHWDDGLEMNDIYEITSSSLTHSMSPIILQGERGGHRKSPFVHENNFGLLEFNEKNRNDDTEDSATTTKVTASIRCVQTESVLVEWKLPF